MPRSTLDGTVVLSQQYTLSVQSVPPFESSQANNLSPEQSTGYRDAYDVQHDEYLRGKQSSAAIYAADRSRQG